jgi:hypothetical protein
VRETTGPDMNRPRIAERNDRLLIASRSPAPVPLAENRGEPQTEAARFGQYSGSGFLLDWLAGGEACKRDIQGFAVRLEDLVVMARPAGRADMKHAGQRK